MGHTNTLASPAAASSLCSDAPTPVGPSTRGVVPPSYASTDVLVAPADAPAPARWRSDVLDLPAREGEASRRARRARPDRGLESRALLLRLQQGLPFLSLTDALQADAALGSAYRDVAEAAARYVLSWTAPETLADTLAQARAAGAQGVASALEDARRLYETPEPLSWQGEALSGQTGEVTGICPVGSGFVTISNDTTVRVWQQAEGLWQSKTLPGHTAGVYGLCPWGAGFITASADKSIRVWRPAGDQWQSEKLEGCLQENVAVYPWASGFVTRSDDRGIHVWQQVAGQWQSEALERQSGINAVYPWGPGFIVAVYDGTLRMWQQVAGQWQSETLEGHARTVFAVCPLGSGLLTMSPDTTLLWQQVEGRWQREELPPLTAIAPSICPWATGFVTVDSWGTTCVSQRVGDRWERQKVMGSTRVSQIGPWGAGFVTGGVNSVQVWQLPVVANWAHACRTRPGPLTLASALELGRLDAALQRWQCGERPPDAMVQAAVRDPASPLAQLAYVAGLELRTASGETLVEAALQAGYFGAAADHMLRCTGGCQQADIDLACTTRGWAVVLALLAGQRVDLDTLLARHPRLLQDVDASGHTLVMAAFAAQHEGLAFALLRRGAIALPHDEGSIPLPVSDAVGRAAATCLQRLETAGRVIDADLRQAPAALRAALLGWALGRKTWQDIDLCLAAARQGALSPEVAIAVIDLVRSTEPNEPALVRSLVLQDLDLWAPCCWEALPYDAASAAALRAWGLHPILLARYVADRAALGAYADLPPGADKLAWLRRVLMTARGAKDLDIDVERQPVGVPGILQGDRAAAAWRRPFSITYNNELGVDLRGLTKDWLTQVAGWFFGPQGGAFAASESDPAVTTFAPNVEGPLSTPHANDLRLAGRLLGKTISLGLPIPLKLAGFLLKQLVGQPVGMADLKTLDPQLADNLQSILSADDVSCFGLTFAWSGRDAAGNATTVPLFPGGETLDVTADNRQDYVDRVVQYLLTTRYALPLTAFAAGLFDVISPRVLTAFSATELDTLIAGPRHIDVVAWAAHTALSKTSTVSNHDARQARAWFFEIVRDLVPEQQAKLLLLVTGASGPPAGGFENLRPAFTLNITRDGRYLPAAHTCFNTVDLPTYSSKSVMLAKLKQFLDIDLSFQLE